MRSPVKLDQSNHMKRPRARRRSASVGHLKNPFSATDISNWMTLNEVGCMFNAPPPPQRKTRFEVNLQRIEHRLQNDLRWQGVSFKHQSWRFCARGCVVLFLCANSACCDVCHLWWCRKVSYVFTFLFSVNVNKMKAFGDIRKAEMLLERQHLEDAKREQRDRMNAKIEVRFLSLEKQKASQFFFSDLDKTSSLAIGMWPFSDDMICFPK